MKKTRPSKSPPLVVPLPQGFGALRSGTGTELPPLVVIMTVFPPLPRWNPAGAAAGAAPGAGAAAGAGAAPGVGFAGARAGSPTCTSHAASAMTKNAPRTALALTGDMRDLQLAVRRSAAKNHLPHEITRESV